MTLARIALSYAKFSSNLLYCNYSRGRQITLLTYGLAYNLSNSAYSLEAA